MVILSKGCKLDNFESHNSLRLSFTNIWGLHSNFVECESFLESNSLDILALWETNLDGTIVSGNFSVSVYLPLIQKDSTTHMHGHSVSYFFSSVGHLLSLCTVFDAISSNINEVLSTNLSDLK